MKRKLGWASMVLGLVVAAVAVADKLSDFKEAVGKAGCAA